MRKLHPKFEIDEKYDSDEPYYQSEVEKEEQKKEVDPRWAALEKLKSKK